MVLKHICISSTAKSRQLEIAFFASRVGMCSRFGIFCICTPAGGVVFEDRLSLEIPWYHFEETTIIVRNQSMPPLESISHSEDDSVESHPRTTRRRGPVKRRNNSSSSTSTKHHIIAHHSYHDHSQEPHEKFTPSNNPSFPVKLHEMLIKTELNDLQSVVSWMPHGRAFVVHNPSAFKALLPNYFKLSKLASFQRQLNLYGFQRLTTGPDKNGYYHELFLRGRMDLVARMQRMKVKGTGVRAKANPDEEPNLYAYPKIDAAGCVLSSEDSPAMTAPEDVPSSISPCNSEPSVVTMEQSAPSIPVLRKVPSEKLLLITKEFMQEQSPTTLPSHHPKAIVNKIEEELGEVNFEKLIEAMFTRNQTMTFADLQKLATV